MININKLLQPKRLVRLMQVLVLGTAAAFGSSVSAATVLQYSPAVDSTQILDLMIDGVSYDVRFEVRLGTDYRDSSSPGTLDFTDEAVANMVRDAINAALNDAGLTVINRKGSIQQSNNFIVPYTYSDGGAFNGSQGMYDAVKGWQTYYSNGSNNTVTLYNTFTTALFTPTPVPLPGSLVLMMSGLAVLAARRRRGVI